MQPTRESTIINLDWVNYHACSLSYYIYVVPKFYISENDFTTLSAKVIQAYIFLNLYTKVPIGLLAEET